MECLCKSGKTLPEIQVRRDGSVVGGYRYCPRCGPNITSGREQLADLLRTERSASYSHVWKRGL